MEQAQLTPAEFQRLAKVVYDNTGIHLEDRKIGMLSNRLRKRLRVLGLSSFEEYEQLVRSERGFQEEQSHFLSAVTTNETYFFRNEKLWHYFTTDLIEHFVRTKRKRGRSLRIWSAASSSGEEAYTAAIALQEHLPEFARWTVTIIGSDISDNVLAKASAGTYNDYAVAQMTPGQIRRWFTKTGDSYQLKDTIRKMVRFQPHNLREPFPNGRFDLVFLRNVLMYFDTPMKEKVIKTVADSLAPGGHLIVGDVDPIRTLRNSVKP